MVWKLRKFDLSTLQKFILVLLVTMFLWSSCNQSNPRFSHEVDNWSIQQRKTGKYSFYNYMSKFCSMAHEIAFKEHSAFKFRFSYSAFLHSNSLESIFVSQLILFLVCDINQPHRCREKTRNRFTFAGYFLKQYKLHLGGSDPVRLDVCSGFIGAKSHQLWSLITKIRHTRRTASPYDNRRFSGLR